jgi:hypothetical protein
MDGKTAYRRRNNGRMHTQVDRSGRSTHFTNRDVVPYNKFFSTKYDCHINFEVSHNPGVLFFQRQVPPLYIFPFFSSAHLLCLTLQVVSGLASVKYLFKYVYKGPDQAELQKRTREATLVDPVTGVRTYSEVVAFQHSRYKPA